MHECTRPKKLHEYAKFLYICVKVYVEKMKIIKGIVSQDPRAGHHGLVRRGRALQQQGGPSSSSSLHPTQKEDDIGTNHR